MNTVLILVLTHALVAGGFFGFGVLFARKNTKKVEAVVSTAKTVGTDVSNATKDVVSAVKK